MLNLIRLSEVPPLSEKEAEIHEAAFRLGYLHGYRKATMDDPKKWESKIVAMYPWIASDKSKRIPPP